MVDLGDQAGFGQAIFARMTTTHDPNEERAYRGTRGRTVRKGNSNWHARSFVQTIKVHFGWENIGASGLNTEALR